MTEKKKRLMWEDCWTRWLAEATSFHRGSLRSWPEASEKMFTRNGRMAILAIVRRKKRRKW